MIRGRRPAYQPWTIKVRWVVYTLGTVQAEPTEGRSLRQSWQDEPYPPIFQQHCVPQWGRGGGPSTNRTVNTRGHKMDGLNINLWSALCHTRKNTQTLGRSWVSWYQRPVLRGRLVEEGRVIRLMLFIKHIRLNANAHYSLSADFTTFFTFSWVRREDQFPGTTLSPASVICAVLSSRASLRSVSGFGHRSSDCQRCSVGDLLLVLNALDGCVNLLPAVRCPLLLREPGGSWVTFTSASAGAHVWGPRRLSATTTQLCRKPSGCLDYLRTKKTSGLVISGIDPNRQALGLFHT